MGDGTTSTNSTSISGAAPRASISLDFEYTQDPAQEPIVAASRGSTVLGRGGRNMRETCERSAPRQHSSGTFLPLPFGLLSWIGWMMLSTLADPSYCRILQWKSLCSVSSGWHVLRYRVQAGSYFLTLFW